MPGKNIYRAFLIKNLLVFLLPMLISISILGTLSFFLISHYTQQNIYTNNRDVLSQTKENIELIFNESDSLNLYIVASAKEFVNLQSIMEKPYLLIHDYEKLASLKRFIDSPEIAKPYIDSIYIYIENDKKQFVSSNIGGLVQLDDFYDRAWYGSFQQHFKKQHIWTESRQITKTYNYASAKQQKVDVITLYRPMPIKRNGVIVLNIEANYIKDYLSHLYSPEKQPFLIVNSDGKTIFQNSHKKPSETEIQRLVNERNSISTVDIDKESFVATKADSSRYGWMYISLTPKSSLMEASVKLTILCFVVIGVSIIAGTLLAYHFTKKNNKDVKRIITIFQAAEEGKTLPSYSSYNKGIYSYIIHRILNNFMENNYLKVLLSERANKEKAMEFAALQEQLNPHFLYNTLETLNWKAIALTGKPNELNGMISHLAAILRYSLDGNNKMVTIKKEISHTKSYIEIQKIRYKERFEVFWDVSDQISGNQVIKLCIQPLIENSLQHGFREELEKLALKIKIRKTEQEFTISVIDNGKGIPSHSLKQLQLNMEKGQESTNHIGLINTHKRLKLTFGDQSGLAIFSKYGWGTVVRIVIHL
ncbi:cache domain-containing sensor histidine kinase [Bacillus sp. 1P06AnD]|uniref:cache domain-containing sensor histidine kinase n=1 Tax=Bacillus sp. 1P06AnD TaxID=3132208 RepID=UPI00399EF5B7